MTGWREEGQRNVSGWPTWACADARLKTNEPKKVTSDHPLLAVPLWETGGVEQKLLPTDYRGALSCEKKDLGLQTFHFEVHIRFIPQAPTSHVWVTLITGLRSCEPAAVISPKFRSCGIVAMPKLSSFVVSGWEASSIKRGHHHQGEHCTLAGDNIAVEDLGVGLLDTQAGEALDTLRPWESLRLLGLRSMDAATLERELACHLIKTFSWGRWIKTEHPFDYFGKIDPVESAAVQSKHYL